MRQRQRKRLKGSSRQTNDTMVCFPVSCWPSLSPLMSVSRYLSKCFVCILSHSELSTYKHTLQVHFRHCHCPLLNLHSFDVHQSVCIFGDISSFFPPSQACPEIWRQYHITVSILPFNPVKGCQSFHLSTAALLHVFASGQGLISQHMGV